jgi:DNA topoisomerase-1
MAKTTPFDSKKLARSAGLHYVQDDTPGIRRIKRGDYFSYRNSRGKKPAAETTERISSLAIPPAWSDVWICPDERGHLQATGHDERGRKQYLYHADWDQARNRWKYHRTIDFARVLPRIREHVRRDLRKRNLSREKVLATVVDLLEKTLIRVGNDEYARDNGSYGLSTFEDRHVELNGSKFKFCFRGKSRQRHCIEVADRRLAKIVRSCRDLPGEQLFQYRDDQGVHDITSTDVNDYLQRAAGAPFTAKDFRTWAATVHAARLLVAGQAAATPTAGNRTVREMIQEVARCLGNTPAVCRKSYIHPAVIDAYLAGRLHHTRRRSPLSEAGVLRLLRREAKVGRKSSG